MSYAYEVGVCCYCPKEPYRFCIEIQSNVHFSVKAEKMSSDYIAQIRTASHCIDTRDFHFLCAKIRFL